MAQGKFSKPRNRSAAPASPAHPPRKKIISPDEDVTMILPKQADTAPSGPSGTNDELDALLRQLNTPQSDPEPEAPVQEAAPPVYNHEIPRQIPPKKRNPMQEKMICRPAFRSALRTFSAITGREC